MKQSILIILAFTAIFALAVSTAGAATAVTVQSAADTGTSLTLKTLASGTDYEIVNNGWALLYVENTQASTCTLTIVTGGSVGGFALADRTVVVKAGGRQVVGPMLTNYYNDTNGRVQFSVDADGVRAAAVRVR